MKIKCFFCKKEQKIAKKDVKMFFISEKGNLVSPQCTRCYNRGSWIVSRKEYNDLSRHPSNNRFFYGVKRYGRLKIKKR